QLAAALGLPYAFAAHFAPTHLMASLALYHQHFRPSVHLDRPRTMIGVNAIAAETEDEAQYLATTQAMMFLELRRGGRPLGRPPTRDLRLSPEERMMLDHVLSCSFVGTPAQVRAGMDAFRAQTRADELIVSCSIFDHELRQRSLRWTADA
ncbi:MAG: LLM class flavin-dependent oxidoreductase, partial [Myxococcales bacterium]|nr:LLM class flavin-dependent oxidoreductase [Myxococcales bacterium]